MTQRIVLRHEHLRGVDFSDLEFAQFVSAGSRLEACTFARSKFRDASFGSGVETSEYVDCCFDGARIRFGPGGYARFVRCSFRDVDLRDWFGFTVELIDCVFSGRLRKAFFNGTVPVDKRVSAGRTHNEFSGNDFSDMELVDVGFRTGIDLRLQRLPTGTEYVFVSDAVSALERAQVALASWEVPESRESASRFIDLLRREVDAGQRQLFIRPADYAPLDGEAVDGVVAAMCNGRR